MYLCIESVASARAATRLRWHKLTSTGDVVIAADAAKPGGAEPEACAEGDLAA